MPGDDRQRAGDLPSAHESEPDTASMLCGGCGSPARRQFLHGALTAGIGLSLLSAARAEDKPGADERPKPGDVFVYAEDDHAGQLVNPADLPLGGPQMQVWPMDPVSKVVRDGSRLNQVLLLRLEPEALDEDTKSHSADGIIAFSAICTHAGCPVTGWIEEDEKRVLKCFCHNSEYDPRQQAVVVFGPAPRKLATLPVKISDGTLMVAGTFLGKVGPSQSG
jgi:rieske iron-sulfur protein